MVLSIPSVGIFGLLKLIAWLMALLVMTCILCRSRGRQHSLGSFSIAVIAAAVCVGVPLALLVARDNVTHIHWGTIGLFGAGALSVSWIACQIITRRAKMRFDTKLFE